MPKDEIDPEDPLELRGVALLTDEDTSEPMAECFIEEFLRLGYGPAQILGLFRNRHYTGPHLVLQNRGEDFVKSKIIEVFGWWGRPVTRRDAKPAAAADSGLGRGPVTPIPEAPGDSEPGSEPAAQTLEFDPTCRDPGGAAVPKLNL